MSDDFRGVALARPRIVRADRADGSFILRSEEPLKPYARCIGEWLEFWAREDPHRVFMAERAGSGWRSLTYAEVLSAVRRIGQSLLDLDVAPDAPVVALSDNSLNLGLLSLAAMHVGRRVAVISSGYTRMTSHYERLFALLDRLGPGLLYAEDAEHYAPAISAWKPRCPVVYSIGATGGALSFSKLMKSQPGPAVEAAFQAVTGDTVARVLLTSGSTGTPKLVANTHRMMCANQQMMAQAWLFIDQAKPVALDWLPWSHTFGANHNLNLVLRNGGSLYIDDGRPLPGQIERTIEGILELRPTLSFSVPRGYDVLLPYLERDETLASTFFSRLDMLFCAGAQLPQGTADRLRALALRVRKEPVFFTTGWGATETAPTATSAHFEWTETRNVGVPLPGVDVKFVPSGERYELRVRGPSVFSKYLGDPEKTATAFDAEGFYSLGDAGRLADPNDPNAGVIFEGRIAENFKLTSGTWVPVGMLRVRAVSAFAPYAQDIVVAGHDREEIGLLIFPTAALRKLAGDEASVLCGKALGEHPSVREALAKVLAALGKDAGSSQRPARAVLLSTQPSIEHGEITDKGYVNQRAVLTLRADDVVRLYSDCPSVIHPM
ncbi:feruloyl-CoA synthase [Ralstonia mojiangensis]|uniref:feruloyl-CoA synthase n=1 Tax=Ralstonia mojiangensis TaxID=2953895 RepID=UPI0021B31D84|nr:feruloyl-CoA synthase [Ralstonia mojiangensis]MCT7325037.1 feruloyl-CoA synthase [Ralstonia mojiangensis]